MRYLVAEEDRSDHSVPPLIGGRKARPCSGFSESRLRKPDYVVITE